MNVIIDTPTKKSGMNLLPEDILLQRQQGDKLRVVRNISLGVLFFLIFITSSVIALEISQKYQLDRTKQKMTAAQEKLAGLQEKEMQADLLKGRLTSIKSHLGEDTNRKAIYNMVTSLLPPDAQLSSFEVGKNAIVLMTLTSPSLSSVDTLFTSLASKDKNKNLISRVELDSLTMSRGPVYKMTLRIMPN